MEIRKLQLKDKDFVLNLDKGMNESIFNSHVYTRTGYIIEDNNKSIGIMYYTLMWNKIPFLNLIYLLENYRCKGFGTQSINLWEDDMRIRGYKMVLVSTQVDEKAQHLYRKLGYKDCGVLILGDTLFKQPAELFMRKNL